MFYNKIFFKISIFVALNPSTVNMNFDSTTCLNCHKEIHGKYCSHCGQSADTHRLSLSHFIAHDVVHGVFHLDKGLLFTIKQVLTRPGYAAMDYIRGKRKSFYNFFYLILLLGGFYSLVSKFYGSIFPALEEVDIEDKTGVNDFLHNYSKAILIGFVPVISFNSYMLYRRVKLNYLEHVIVSVLAFIGVLLTFIGAKLLEPLELLRLSALESVISWLHFIAVLVYTNLSFYQAFKGFYSKKGIFFRFLLFCFLVFVEIVVFFVVLIVFFGGGGTISI